MLVWTTLAMISCGNQEPGEHAGPGGSDSADDADDADGDGFVAPEDCNDDDARIHPGATEVCDALDTDEDCDTFADDDDGNVDRSTAPLNLYSDGDGDLYGADINLVPRCDPGGGYVDDGGDCDDTNAAVHPGAEEVCDDGIDNDCDLIDDPCLTTVELSTSDADATIEGLEPDGFGNAIAAAGDMNGDGVDDLAAGPSYFTGSAYLFNGPLSSTTTADAAATIQWTNKGDGLGNEMVGIGDQDGDGFDDLMVLAPLFPALTQYGRAYVLLGPLTGSATAEVLASATITGESADRLGASAASGDVNGDNVPDVLVAAPYGNSNEGASYLFFGPVSGALGEADADALFAVPPEFEQEISNASGGDIDGDGVDELVVGIPFAYGPKVNRGVAGVFFGPVAGSYTLADPDVSVGTSEDGSHLGLAASIHGDLDADGADDLVVSAYEKVAVFYAEAVLSASEHDVDDGDALIEGVVLGGSLGMALDSGGDFDDDGLDDLVASAPWEATATGSVYGFYGPLSGVFTAPERANFRIAAEKVGALLGSATIIVGDVRGNGIDDLAVGANGAVFVFDGGGR
jgi:hypothetical protein